MASENEYTRQIWDGLLAVVGNEIGVAALMGNFYSESGCTPWACQPTRPRNICETYIAKVDSGEITRTQFYKGGCSATGGYTSVQLGFGLAQWTFGARKAALYDFAKARGTSIADISMQIAFIIKELTEGYTGVLNALRTATDITAATRSVMSGYEQPADQSATALKNRANNAIFYLNLYGGGVVPGDNVIISARAEGGGRVSPTQITVEKGSTVSFQQRP